MINKLLKDLLAMLEVIGCILLVFLLLALPIVFIVMIVKIVWRLM